MHFAMGIQLARRGSVITELHHLVFMKGTFNIAYQLSKWSNVYHSISAVFPGFEGLQVFHQPGKLVQCHQPPYGQHWEQWKSWIGSAKQQWRQVAKQAAKQEHCLAYYQVCQNMCQVAKQLSNQVAKQPSSNDRADSTLVGIKLLLASPVLASCTAQWPLNWPRHCTPLNCMARHTTELNWTTWCGTRLHGMAPNFIAWHQT